MPNGILVLFRCLAASPLPCGPDPRESIHAAGPPSCTCSSFRFMLCSCDVVPLQNIKGSRPSAFALFGSAGLRYSEIGKGGRPPKRDKSAILVDAAVVTQLRGESQKLKDSNSDLQEKIK